MTGTVLTVGYEPDFAPLTCRSDGDARGMIVDIVTGAMKRAGVATTFVAVDLPDQEAAIGTAGVDALAFKAIIPDRVGKFDFSDALTTSGAAWFVPAEGKVPDGAGPPEGTRLATPVRGPLSAQLRRDYPELVPVDVDTYGAALTAVAEGSADCAALNFHVGCYLANRDFPGRFTLPAGPFQKMPLGFCVARGKFGDMLSDFNAALAEMVHGGEVSAIEFRWLSGA